MKYLACDLDGTLIQEDQTIKKEDIEAILELKKSGHKLIISTGRGLTGIERAFSNYPEVKYDYIVACNGSLVLNSNGEIVYNNYISSEVGRAILEEFLEENDIYLHFASEGKSCVIEPKNIELEEHMIEFSDKVINHKDLFLEDRKYDMLGFNVENKDIVRAEELKNRVVESYGDILEAFRNQHFIDIAPKDCSKGNGLKKLMEIIDFDTENLYTIGDSYNDISMFNLTKNSFTFHYAEEKLKPYANNCVGSVSECINTILNK